MKSIFLALLAATALYSSHAEAAAPTLDIRETRALTLKKVELERAIHRVGADGRVTRREAAQIHALKAQLRAMSVTFKRTR